MASLQCRRPLPREVITVHISYFLRLGHEEAFGQSAGPLSEAGGRKGQSAVQTLLFSYTAQR